MEFEGPPGYPATAPDCIEPGGGEACSSCPRAARGLLYRELLWLAEAEAVEEEAAEGGETGRGDEGGCRPLDDR